MDTVEAMEVAMDTNHERNLSRNQEGKSSKSHVARSTDSLDRHEIS